MRRYVVLLASLVIQICLGGIYVWSEFVQKLKTEYGISTTQTQLIFGTTIATFTVAMVFAGRLQDKKGPGLVAFIGGILFGTGYLVGALSGGNFSMLIIGIGIISGIGIGFGYVAPLATCVKWFPKNKGLVTGISVAGFGGGAIILSKVVEFGFSRNLDVLEVFSWIGVVCGVLVVVSALFLSEPPVIDPLVKVCTLRLSFLIRDRNFWMMLLGMFSGTFAGLLVIGNLKPMGISLGLSSAVASTGISFFALGNALGRISWGKYYDKVGGSSVPHSLLFLAFAVGALLLPGGSEIVFIVTSMLIGFGFGACFVLYASSAADVYGIDVLGVVYPWIFLAYGFSGIAGPAAGGWLFDSTGSHSPAIMLAACLTAVSALGCRLLYYPEPISKKCYS